MHRYSIVIPVYDHPDCMPWMIDRLRSLGLSVILVNDGSSEACSRVLRELALNNPWVSLIERAKNGGKGAAVKDGLREAFRLGFTHALQIDADGQHNMDDIPAMLAESAKHPNAVISGTPRFENIPKLRYYGRYLTHLWVWINTWSMEIKDSMCGFRIYPLDATCKIIGSVETGDRMDFDFEILVRLHWCGVPVVSFPTTVNYPRDGISHFRGFQDNVLISRMHARLFFEMLLRIPELLHRKRHRHV